jgi:hypothetical protein
LAGNFINRLFEELSLLFAGLPLHSSHVAKRKYYGQAGKHETGRPVQDERHFAQRLPQDRFAEEQHDHGDDQKSHAAFAMPKDAIIGIHGFKIASKYILTERFLAGISAAPNFCKQETPQSKGKGMNGKGINSIKKAGSSSFLNRIPLPFIPLPFIPLP